MSATDLFDTTTVPNWRPAGTVNLEHPARLLVGDPCIGLSDTDITLAAGAWRWEVRDADDTGASALRPWEVRLVRADQPPADDWDWVDDYGQWNTEPAADTQALGVRGVDGGMIAWEVTSRPGPGLHDSHTEWDELVTWPLPEEATHGGTVLCTSTGFGDGVYPLVARTTGPAGTDSPDVVEVRACYISPDPGPLSVTEFFDLLAAVLPDGFADPRHGATVHLEVTQHAYTDTATGDHSSYESAFRLHGAHERTAQVVTNDESEEPSAENVTVRYDRGLIECLDALWTRLPDGARTEIVTGTESRQVGEPWQISDTKTETTSRVTYTLTLPAAS